MANDNDSVDSNGNSTDLRPRRSNRAKGKPIQQLEETDENLVVHNNVVYKVGDFVYYLDKKQDIYRIGLIEEFKHQKRDKLVNKRPEISLKQFYRLDEIPVSVLSNQGEYDTHIMPPNFPEWLRQREIFISDNALSTSCSSLRSLCTVRHFPDLNHAMALFSTAQSSGQVTNSSPRVDHHTLITGKDNGCIPVPKQRDDNTFFYVYSYNARGRKLAATYLEIRVGPSYQAELPELHSLDDQATDSHYIPGAWELLMWKPNQIPDEVFNVYNMATISIACFSGFGGGVDDSASVENGRKIASHMLTCQRALDCLHKSQYIMEKAMEIFAENSLPETSKMPFLWTDEDHVLFDESVKIHGKNFLRIMQDKRNKKGRLVGDYVTFYYYWKKNRPKNRKYTTKKNLRSRTSNAPLSEQINNQEGTDPVKKEPTVASTENNGSDKPNDGENQSPNDPSVECCCNCKAPLPKTEEEASPDSDKTLLSDRMKMLCFKCQHYLRRYGYQKPVEIIDKIKASDDEDEIGDFEEGINGFDEEEDEEEVDGEEDEEDDLFQGNNSPQNPRETEDIGNKYSNQSTTGIVLDNKNTLAINKYDFDEEDENVEEVSSYLKRTQVKQNLLRETDGKAPGFKVQSNGSGFFSNNAISNYSNKPQNKSNSVTSTSTTATSQPTKNSIKPCDSQTKSNKRSGLLKKYSTDNCKKRKVETIEDAAVPRSSSVTSRNSILNPSVRKQIHESLKSSLSQSQPGGFSKKLEAKKSGIIGQTEINSSQYDSNSSTSSSSSSSNDSSSSDEESASLPITKLTAANLNFPSAKQETNGEIKVDTSSKDSADNSYNQMITSIPNIPGVCAVTNVGEPMPQLMQNLSTDLSAIQPSSVSDLNITVAEPLYKQLSLKTTLTTTSTVNLPTTACEPIACVNKISQSVGPIVPEPISKFVNFNAISNQRIDGNPEETGLNLVKPKKRTESSCIEHNWAPPHESPSKLVHHRGDNSQGDTVNVETPRQMINDNEVVHGSMFGHIVRVIKSGDGCARTDLQHITSSLKPADIENKRNYINKNRVSESIATNTNTSTTTSFTSMVNHDSSKRQEDIKKPCSMPPPTEKNLVHHPSTSTKNFSIPPLTHSSSGNSQQSSISNQSHNRKINGNSSSHGLRSPSPANNSRPQSSFPSISSNIIRPNHIHNSSLHNISNQSNNVRPNMHMNPNMQSVANSPLLADYNNMNKVNLNDMLLYHSLSQYEEMAKQNEIQKLLMMYNLGGPPVRPMQWDQRDRYGSSADAWAGSLSGSGVVPMGPGVLPMNADLQNILRALSQTQQQPSVVSPHNRPRSATGLNLSNAMVQGGGMPGGSGVHGDKPSSGRASVNHEFQRPMDPGLMTENAEMLEIMRMLMASSAVGGGAGDLGLQYSLGLPKVVPGSGMHQQQQQSSQGSGQVQAPPLAHALSNLAGVIGSFPGPHMAGVLPPSLLAQMQAQNQGSQASAPASGPPPAAPPPLPSSLSMSQGKQGPGQSYNGGPGGPGASTGPSNGQGQGPSAGQRQSNWNDLVHMFMNRGAPR